MCVLNSMQGLVHYYTDNDTEVRDETTVKKNSVKRGGGEDNFPPSLGNNLLRAFPIAGTGLCLRYIQIFFFNEYC